MASLRPGKKAQRARSRLYFCLISFRATCFVATRALSRPMRWRALPLIARWRAALIRRQTAHCPSGRANRRFGVSGFRFRRFANTPSRHRRRASVRVGWGFAG